MSRVFDTDVVVAGGGPVGLVAALEARRLGLDVVVVEPRPVPRDKACGEGLMPGALRHLAALGIDPPGRRFRGIRYVGDGRHVDAVFSRGPGMGVRRTDLYAVLHAAATSAGARWHQAAVRTVEQDSYGVRAGGVRGRWLLAADGLHSTVRRQVGLARPAGSAPPRYGLRRHFRVAPWSDLVEVHWGPWAEAYVTPVAAYVVGVAVLGPAGLGFDEAVAELPGLTARLRGAAAVTEVRGAGPLRQRATSVRTGRVLLVGDAAGYVDALTGEGLAVGMRSARAAVAAIVRGRPADYEQAWARETRRYRLLTSALLAAAGTPRARTALVPAAVRLPAVYRRAVELLT